MGRLGVSRLRAIVEAEAEGLFELPENIDDGELLFTGLVRTVRGKLKTWRAQADAAEVKSTSLKRQLGAAETNVHDLEASGAKMARDLAQSQRKIGDFEAKVAFLGKRWEQLTGEINSLQVQDPQAFTRTLKSELEATKTTLVESQLGARVIGRKFEEVCTSARQAEAQMEQWGREITALRKREQELDAEVVRLTGSVDRLSSELSSTQTKLRDAEANNTRLGAGFSRSESRLQGSLARAVALDGALQSAAKNTDEIHTGAVETETKLRRSLTERHGLEANLAKTQEASAQLQARTNQLEGQLRSSEHKAAEAGKQLRDEEARSEKLSSDFQVSKSQASRLSFELEACRRHLREAEADAAALKQVAVRCQQDIGGYSERLQSTTAASAKLFSELSHSQTRLLRTETQVLESEGLVRDSQTRLRRVDAGLKQSEMTNSRLVSELRATEVRLQDSQAEVAKQRGLIDRNVEQLRLAHSELSASDQRANSLAEDLNTSKAHVRSLQDDAARLDREFKRKSNDQIACEARAKDANSRFWHLAGDAHRTRQRLQCSEASEASLDGALARNSAGLQSTQSQLQEVRSKALELGTTLAATEQQLTVTKVRCAELETQVGNQSTELASLRTAVFSSNRKAGSFRKALEEERKELALANTDVSALAERLDCHGHEAAAESRLLAETEARVTRLTNELTSTQARLKQAESQAAQLDGSADRLASDLKHTRTAGTEAQRRFGKDLGGMRAQLQAAESELDILRLAMDTTCKELNAAEERAHVEGHGVQGLQAELSVYKDKLSISEAQAAEARATAGGLQRELDGAKVKLCDKEREAGNLAGELRRSRGMLRDINTEASELRANVALLMDRCQHAPAVAAVR